MYLVYFHCVNSISGTKEKMRLLCCKYFLQLHCDFFLFWLYKVLGFNVGVWEWAERRLTGDLFEFWKSGIS